LVNKLGISNVAPEGFVADNVIYSFYIGAVLLIISILYTIITTKEYSPEEFAAFEDGKEIEHEKSKFSDIFKDFATIPAQMKNWELFSFSHGLHYLPCGYLQPVLCNPSFGTFSGRYPFKSIQ
jgi:maltose/moltooligosaccharide transporter